jgi:hypothetical protein
MPEVNINSAHPAVAEMTPSEKDELNRLVQIIVDFNKSFFYGSPMPNVEAAAAEVNRDLVTIKKLSDKWAGGAGGKGDYSTTSNLSGIRAACDYIKDLLNGEFSSEIIKANFTNVDRHTKEIFDFTLNTLRENHPPIVSETVLQQLGGALKVGQTSAEPGILGPKNYEPTAPVVSLNRANEEGFSFINTRNFPMSTSAQWQDIDKTMAAIMRFRNALVAGKANYPEKTADLASLNEIFASKKMTFAASYKGFKFIGIILSTIVSAAQTVQRTLADVNLKDDFSNLTKRQVDNFSYNLHEIADAYVMDVSRIKLELPKNFAVKAPAAALPRPKAAAPVAPAPVAPAPAAPFVPPLGDRYIMACQAIDKRIDEMKAFYQQESGSIKSSDKKFDALAQQLSATTYDMSPEQKFQHRVNVLESAFDEAMKPGGMFGSKKSPQDIISKMNENDREHASNPGKKLDNNFKRMLVVALKDVYQDYGTALNNDPKRDNRTFLAAGVTSLSYKDKFSPIGKNLAGEPISLAPEAPKSAPTKR